MARNSVITKSLVRTVMLASLVMMALPALSGGDNADTSPSSATNNQSVNEEAILNGGYVGNLSEFGLFADLTALEPANNVHPYTLNAALFSDYAQKKRLIYVPAGSDVGVDDINAVVQLPLGSVLVKTFGYPDAEGVYKPLETRLLLHRTEGWVALPYIWNEDRSDAKLALGGRRMMVDATLPDGSRQQISYAVPNKNQCKGCHSLDNIVTPIGPKLRNLNDGDGSGQITLLQNAGVLPDILPDHPVMPAIDAQAPLADRARAYLDINCSHCHNRKGPASNSGLFLTYQEDNAVALGIGKRPVAAGRGSGGRDFAIAPGHADQSIMLYRMGSIEPGIAMPELGRNVNDQAGLALIGAWIDAMESSAKPE